MICFAVVAFDFGTGALIFVESSAAAPRTRRCCFKASVHCVPKFKIFLAAHWFLTIFLNFSFCLSSGILTNLGDSFSLKVRRSGVEIIFLVFIQVAFCMSESLYSFFSSLH